MSYRFTDYGNMVGKRPRQAYWQEVQDAVLDLDVRLKSEVSESDGHEVRKDNPHNVTTQQVNVIEAKLATAPVQEYPVGLTVFQITETVNSGYPESYGIVETIYFSEHRNIQHFFTKPVSDTDAGHTYYRKWNPTTLIWTAWEKVTIKDELIKHTNNADIHFSATERTKLQSVAEGSTKVEDSPINGNIKITDRHGIVSDVNVYTHPSGDGNLHVPVTGTTNNTRVLKAGSTEGSIAWGQVQFSEVGGVITDTQHGTRGGGELHTLVTQINHGFMSKDDKVKLDNITADAKHVAASTINGNILIDGAETIVYTHPATHAASMIVEDTTRRFVSDTEKSRWNDTYTTSEINNKFSTLETSMDWKESVATFNDISTRYPTPQDGWTVNVNDTDITYRFNGTQWIAISANAIPNATQTVDGKMSKEDKTKLDGVQAGAEVNQSAFSHIAIGTTTVSADTKTDTLTLIAGTNIAITPDAVNDTITIDVSGSVGDANTLGGHTANEFMKKNADSDLIFPIFEDSKSMGVKFVGATDRHEIYIEEYFIGAGEKTRLVFLNTDGGDEDHTVFRNFDKVTGVTSDILGIFNTRVDVFKQFNAKAGLNVTGDVVASGNFSGGTFNGIDVGAFKTSFDSHVGSVGSAHGIATTTVAGFMSGPDKTKLDGISATAEENQFAFSTFKMLDGQNVGATTKTDSITFVPGTNVGITMDNAAKTVTFSISGDLSDAQTLQGLAPADFLQSASNLVDLKDRNAGRQNLGFTMGRYAPSGVVTGDMWIDVSDLDIYNDANYSATQLQYETDQKALGNKVDRAKLSDNTYYMISTLPTTTYNYDGTKITPSGGYAVHNVSAATSYLANTIWTGDTRTIVEFSNSPAQ